MIFSSLSPVKWLAYRSEVDPPYLPVVLLNISPRGLFRTVLSDLRRIFVLLELKDRGANLQSVYFIHLSLQYLVIRQFAKELP